MNLTVLMNFIGVKMTTNCDYKGVILPVENKILHTSHIELDKNTSTFLHFLQKYSGHVFASGKNGSNPRRMYKMLLYWLLCSHV